VSGHQKAATISVSSVKSSKPLPDPAPGVPFYRVTRPDGSFYFVRNLNPATPKTWKVKKTAKSPANRIG